MLKEKAGQYYFVQDKAAAEAILLAANEAYHLGMTEEATKLFAGFRTGMGMGGTCGALSGAIGVLSSKYGTREDLKTICADFVAAFEQKLRSAQRNVPLLRRSIKQRANAVGMRWS